METLRLDWPLPAVNRRKKRTVRGVGGSLIEAGAPITQFCLFSNWISAEQQNKEIEDIQAPNTAKEEKKQIVVETPKELKRKQAAEKAEEEIAAKARKTVSGKTFLKTIFDS